MPLAESRLEEPGSRLLHWFLGRMGTGQGAQVVELCRLCQHRLCHRPVGLEAATCLRSFRVGAVAEDKFLRRLQLAGVAAAAIFLQHRRVAVVADQRGGFPGVL